LRACIPLFQWNRDRFVLSNGHGCTLQYILLHLAGFKVSMDDLKSFRAIDSITPGRADTPNTQRTHRAQGKENNQSVLLAHFV